MGERFQQQGKKRTDVDFTHVSCLFLTQNCRKLVD